MDLVPAYLPAAERYEQIPYRRCGSSALSRPGFDAEELAEIDRYAREGEINIWAESSQA